MKTAIALILTAAFAASSAWAAQPTGEGGKDNDRTKIEDCLNRHLPKISTAKAEDRKQTLRTMAREMEQLRHKQIVPQEAARQRLSQDLIRLLPKLADGGDRGMDEREIVVEMLALHGDGQQARKALFDVLDKGPDKLRKRALLYVGISSAMAGADTYQEIDQLYKKSLISLPEKLAYQVRIDRKRVLPEIQRNVRATKDKKLFVAAATQLQTYEKPEMLIEILPRIKELRLDQKYDEYGDGLYWINSDFYGRVLEMASGSILETALEIACMPGGPATYKFTDVLRRRLDDPNPRVRLLAAKALARAGAKPFINNPELLGALRKRLDLETEPGIQREFRATVKGIESQIDRWKEFARKAGAPQ